MPGHFDPGHDGHVAGLHAPVRKIDRGRGLGRARHAYEHDISLLKTFEMLAVVVQHRVVESVDALEIFRVERVLRDDRSEEHTSELQSHVNLVCRLLLEKKKKRKLAEIRRR